MSALLTAAERAGMQTLVNSSFRHTGELWRIGTNGRRSLYLSGVALALWPGGDVSLNDDALGVVGQNSTYIGFVARDLDIRENDQFRNVRLDGALWMDRYNADGTPSADGMRFTVGTVEKWPTVIRLRIHEEGT